MLMLKLAVLVVGCTSLFAQAAFVCKENGSPKCISAIPSCACSNKGNCYGKYGTNCEVCAIKNEDATLPHFKDWCNVNGGTYVWYDRWNTEVWKVCTDGYRRGDNLAQCEKDAA